MRTQQANQRTGKKNASFADPSSRLSSLLQLAVINTGREKPLQYGDQSQGEWPLKKKRVEGENENARDESVGL